VTFTPDVAGRWTIRWTSTTPAGAYTDIANVWPQQPGFLISVDDARQALGMREGTSADVLDELRLFIAAATPVIEDITGPILVRQQVVEISPNWSYTFLPGYRGQSVAVTYKDTSTPLDVSQFYTDDLTAGVLYLNPTSRPVLVTYSVGTGIIAPNVQLATRELVRHLWQIARQAGRTNFPGQPADGIAYTPTGYAVPKRVIELAGGSIGGFA
jgi:hypothetical protein